MITETGMNILAKYLIGQAPAYASYIAVGCGAKPLSSSAAVQDYSKKELLDFEMFRVPIISRGYVTDILQANITGVSANGSIITYTAENTFVSGDIVDITGTNVSEFNISEAVVNSASSTQFTVLSSATGTYISGGTAKKSISKIVFTAELPTEERYEISEVGVYSAASNPSALNSDSKLLYSFNSQSENWEYHTQNAATAIPVKYSPLDINPTGGNSENDSIAITEKAFNVNSDNEIFINSIRSSRNEIPRLLNNSIALVGDDADLTINKKTITGISYQNNELTITSNNHGFSNNQIVDISGVNIASFNLKNKSITKINDNQFKIAISGLVGSPNQSGYVEGRLDNFNYNIESGSNHIHISGISLDLDKNSPNDLLKLAFSLVSKSVNDITIPDSVKVLVEFASTEIGDREYARFEQILYHDSTAGSINNFNTNRYFVVSSTLQDLVKTSGFTWASVEVIKIYVSVYKDGIKSNNFYVFLDGLRFENITNTNPLYGLTGYSIIRNQSANTVVKLANTNNFIEFRFALDVT